MKKLLILFVLFFINVYSAFSQSNIYEPFKVNLYKTSMASGKLDKYVDDADIVDVNFELVNRIIDSGLNTIKIKIPYKGSDYYVTLQKFDILKNDAKIVSGTEEGDIPVSGIHEFAAYTGNLNDKFSPLVTVTFFRDDVSAMIITKEDTYVLAKQKNSSEFISYQNSKVKIHREFNCGADELGIPDRITQIQKNLDGNMNPLASNTLLKADIAIESDFEFYTFSGNSVERASNYIISLYVPVSALYVRDANVQLQIGYLRVWSISGDPYPDATSSSTLLNAFRSYWNANMQSTPRTIAHYISTRPGGLGGIAWVDVLCSNTSSGYGYAFSDIDGTFNQLPAYSWDVMVVAHETGHNFGSPHTHNCSWAGGPIDSCYTVEGGCYSGPQIPRVGTIMSYCHLNGSIALYFGPLPSQLIRNRAESAPCLTQLSGYLVATPNGGQVFRSGNNALVIWGTSNTGNVNIEYSTNNGTNWNVIQNNVSAVLRTINWNIPYISTTTQARVRVYETGNTSNGDQSDSSFQVRPSINSFLLAEPPQLFRTNVSMGDTSNIHFKFFRAGTLPEFKYKLIISTTNNSYTYSKFTNNSGSDTVLSVSRHLLDSLITSWGAVNIGDSLRVKWTAKCYTQFDSLSSSSNYLITFIRTVIGITPVSNVIPKEYFINPNYPNPFNPVTKIKFGLPSRSKVTLSVFDLLGRQVENIVNSDLEAGEYQADWNAGSFASGIYFYKIEAFDRSGKSFIETRKMVLIK